MSENFTRWTSASKGLALGTLLAGAAALPAAAQTVYGLAPVASTGAFSLVSFAATAPGTLTATLPITGLTAGQTLVGLDSRPNTGQLFALGYNPTGTQAQMYTLNPTTGALATVGAAFTLNLGAATNRIGFDFNPTVDRIRVTGSNNSNFRLNPNNGALAATDGTLVYNPGNATATPPVPADVNAGQTPGVGSVAYANSFIGATATVLYDIDEANSRYTTQNPPNDGFLNSREQLSVNTATALATDLDIYFNPTTRVNNGYLTIATGTTAAPATQLYTLDFMTGAGLTAVGAIGPVGTLVTDIAFAIDRTVPTAITGQLAYALAGGNLVTFDTALPGTIRTSVGITGVAATQMLVGLDVRPLTNSLYALGYNIVPDNSLNPNAQLYFLNATTGVATAVGAAIRLELGTGSAGFDFNPTVDRIRVVGANRNNYRLNPNNPATGVLAATDAPVSYPTGTATPSIGAVAYTNSFMGAGSTSGTILYNYDEALNQLNTQNTAAGTATDGQLTRVGASGITVNTTAPNVDLDIYSTGVGMNTAYLVANTGTSANTSLYTVDLTAGTATLVGAIGNGLTARDIAVAAATGVVSAVRTKELATNLALYPNPLAATARVTFGLPRAARVTLTVTDVLGRPVDQVNAGQLPAGTQSITWNRKGQKAGLYFFRLSFDGQPAGTRQGILTE